MVDFHRLRQAASNLASKLILYELLKLNVWAETIKISKERPL